MNRLVRDEIVHTALDMADIATLDVKDRPEGVLMPNAISVKWLQHILDTFHHRYPFQTDLKAIQMVMLPGTNQLIIPPTNPELPPAYLPEDYMLDVKDGIILTTPNETSGRLRRRAFQNYLNIQVQFQHTRQPWPVAYTIYNDIIHCAPHTEDTVNLVLWYYALPRSVEAQDKLRGIDDWVAIEYVRLRALEWVRLMPPGSAKEYMNKELASLKSQGLLGDTEYEKLPLGNYVYLDTIQEVSPFSWMGSW